MSTPPKVPFGPVEQAEKPLAHRKPGRLKAGPVWRQLGIVDLLHAGEKPPDLDRGDRPPRLAGRLGPLDDELAVRADPKVDGRRVPGPGREGIGGEGGLRGVGVSMGLGLWGVSGEKPDHYERSPNFSRE